MEIFETQKLVNVKKDWEIVFHPYLRTLADGMVIPIPSFLVSPYSLSLQCDFFLSRENSLSFILIHN